MSNNYIEFKLVEKKPKTSVFDVINKKWKYKLGTIRWYPKWRQYCFFPEENTIFSKNCMKTIKEFIDVQMFKRDLKLKKDQIMLVKKLKS